MSLQVHGPTAAQGDRAAVVLGQIDLTTVTPSTPTPTPEVQAPTNSCLTGGTSSSYAPACGTKGLMKPGCITNADQHIGPQERVGRLLQEGQSVYQDLRHFAATPRYLECAGQRCFRKVQADQDVQDLSV